MALGALWNDFLVSFLNDFFLLLFVPALLETPELDFERILEGLGGILGGFWERLGSFFRQLML